jgi:hypothetical protein
MRSAPTGMGSPTKLFLCRSAGRVTVRAKTGSCFVELSAFACQCKLKLFRSSIEVKRKVVIL